MSRNIKIDAVALAQEVIVLRRQNEILTAGLNKILQYGSIGFKDGLRSRDCGYGCESPGDAADALEAVRKEAQP